MEGPEFVLAVVAMAMGTGIIITVITKGVDLIKAWINRNNASYDGEKFDRLAKAFIRQKNDMERRMQHIEAIITDEEPAELSVQSRDSKKLESRHAIEIEDDYEREQPSSGELKNMLNNKRTK
jgi:hypothetical protein